MECRILFSSIIRKYNKFAACWRLIISVLWISLDNNSLFISSKFVRSDFSSHCLLEFVSHSLELDSTKEAWVYWRRAATNFGGKPHNFRVGGIGRYFENAAWIPYFVDFSHIDICTDGDDTDCYICKKKKKKKKKKINQQVKKLLTKYKWIYPENTTITITKTCLYIFTPLNPM